MVRLLAVLATCLVIGALGCSPRAPEPGVSDVQTSIATPAATPTPTPAFPSSVTRRYSHRQAPAPPDSVTFDVGPGVAPELAEAARTATGATVKFFSEKYGYDLSAVTVHIHTDDDGFVDAMMKVWASQGRYPDRATMLAQWSRWGGTAFDGNIFLHPRSASESTIDWLWQSVPHEATHLLQRHLVSESLGYAGWDRMVTGAVPTWLTEGHAEYVGAHVQAIYSPQLFEFVERTRHLPSHRWSPRTLYETARDDPAYATRGHDVYTLGLAAVDVLLIDDDDGNRVLSFWRLLGEEVWWEDAFEQAFGLPPSEFYDQFEAARK